MARAKNTRDLKNEDVGVTYLQTELKAVRPAHKAERLSLFVKAEVVPLGGDLREKLLSIPIKKDGSPGAGYLAAVAIGKEYLKLADGPGERERIEKLLTVFNKFWKSWDLFVPDRSKKEPACWVNGIFAELKVTAFKKGVKPRSIREFFFLGATRNEFQFAQLLGERFRFYLVETKQGDDQTWSVTDYLPLSTEDFARRIQSSRTQYQITLGSEGKVADLWEKLDSSGKSF